jgi:hypothetical protein
MAVMDSKQHKKSSIFMFIGQKLAFLVYFQIVKFWGPPPGGSLKCRRSVQHFKNVLTLMPKEATLLQQGPPPPPSDLRPPASKPWPYKRLTGPD